MQLSLFDVQLCLFSDYSTTQFLVMSSFTERLAAMAASPTRVTKCDPYTVSLDGHYIGHDGFIVPKNFHEFYDRYPRYIKQFVMRFMRNNTGGEREEHENNLILFLLTLPPDSKFRKPGCNGHPEGCTDRLQIFDPELSFGCSVSRWKSWLNRCLSNELLHLLGKVARNPIQCYSTVTLTGGYVPDRASHGGGKRVNEEVLLRRARGLSGMPCRDEIIDLNREVLLGEFRSFVGQHNPELSKVVETLSVADNCTEARETLDLSKRMFKRAHARLCVLAKSFAEATQPPVQRKMYRLRKPALVAAG